MTNPKKFFALLVGIDKYPDGIPQLSGCVNDILSIEKILLEKYSHLQPAIQTLSNEKATRKAIIDAFRTHLSKASAQDTVLFYYSGHGSTENSPQAFWEIEPSRKNETLVCYDSRQAGGSDLADKELAVLLAEIGKKTQQIVVCLDSCHSGSGTRDTVHLAAVRQIPKDANTRFLESYLDGYYERQLLETGEISVPRTTHVLLSACQNTEKAYENDERHGVFTSALVACLKNVSGGGITYAELFSKISIEVRNKQRVQHPNFEYFNQFNPHTLFLTNTISDRIRTFPIYYNKAAKQWKAGKGALHGLPIENADTIKIWIFGASETNLEASNKMAEAVLDDIEPEEATLKRIDSNLNTEKSYIGLQVAGGLKNASVYSFAPVEGLTALFEYDASEHPDQADYWLLKEGALYKIVHRLSIKLIAQSIHSQDINSALQKIARWENLKKLRNPKSKIPADTIEVIFKVAYQEFKENKIEIPLGTDSEGNTEFREYDIEVINNTTKSLYFNTVFVSPLYGIISMNKASTVIPSGEKGYLVKESKLGFFESQKNDTESNGLFKIIASTQDIDLSAFIQSNFSLNVDFSQNGKGEPRSSFRGGKFIDEANPNNSNSLDWVVAKDINLRMIKSVHQIKPSETLTIAENNISFQAHKNLKADVTFSQFFDAGRSAQSSTFIAESAAKNHGFALVDLVGNTRSLSSQIIELQNIEGDVSPESPLILTITNKTIAEEELVVPVAIVDSELVVMGSSKVIENGSREVYIEQLPEASPQQSFAITTRSIGRAIKFCLMKIVFKVNPSKYFQLRRIDFDKGKAERTTDDIKEKVAEANTIVLLVHGIIGDTEAMIPFISKVVKADRQKEAKYDLALTFDYECLNTPIEEIAANLINELSNIGISETSGKKVTIVAHSMGGLVSRYLIEKLGKGKLVEKLIMAGTPNGGSALGAIPGYLSFASDALTFGLGLAFAAPYLSWAAGLIVVLRKSTTITHTLAQMDRASGFIRDLNIANDPHIAYYILAGRIDKYVVDGEKWFDRAGKRLLLSIGNVFHEGEEHDIAVYTADIKRVDGMRSPKPVKEEPGCPHVLYYEESGSVEMMHKWLLE
ncbi:caspase family protein [Emticicia sp. C21]|uniref:caspase family protein n=1 Tax=Emticicia sp. C21 TaxID=2302915 RepID=UPI000E355A4B|nr:caspase family protein [Emticicia sp. C21]RFS17353.1 hypothetical protein D0T08_06120 [Emticicia sp. C21]